jgi:hypothetical protein
MVLEEAKKFIGREATYQNLSGKILRVSHPFGIEDPGMVIAELDNGVVVNIDLLKYLDKDGNWQYLT